MKRQKLINYINDTYAVEPEGMWAKFPNYRVFRHSHGRKWFAILMDAPNKTLGISNEGTTDVLDVKLDKRQIDELLASRAKGFLPAYHMNKSTWISAVIAELADEQLEKLIATSYQNTQK